MKDSKLISKVFVGLPCYNEEKDINELINRVLEMEEFVKSKFDLEMQILCVNDGSVDETQRIIEARQEKNICLINHERNKGLGEAVKTILKEFKNQGNKNDYLIIMDADNSHNPKHIIDLIQKQIQENSDIVIASRYQKGSTISGLKKNRILISNLAKIWYTKTLRIPNVKDYTCGYRLYTYDCINSAIEKYGNEIITQSSFACMMELLYNLHKNGAQISEIPFGLEYEKKQRTK